MATEWNWPQVRVGTGCHVRGDHTELKEGRSCSDERRRLNVWTDAQCVGLLFAVRNGPYIHVTIA